MPLPPFFEKKDRKEETRTTSFRLRVSVLEWLEETATRTGMSKAEVVTECILHVKRQVEESDAAAAARGAPLKPKQK